MPRQGGSTHPWVGYVNGDCEERCFLAMLVADGESLGEEVVGVPVLNWDDLPFAKHLIPLARFRRFAGTCELSI